MVIVRLLGGFASQLQQYSIAYLLAQDKNTDLYLDLSEYLTGYFRPFMLGTVKLPQTYMVRDNSLIKSAVPAPDGDTLISIYEREIFPNVYICSEAETYRSYFNKYPKLYPDVHMELFKSIRLKYKSEFLESFQHSISNCYSIGVHVRLGDFSTINWTDSFDGYRGAIGRLMEQHITDGHVFFFSNDINEARRIFGDSDKFSYVHQENGYLGDAEEFMALSMCRGKVISTRSGYSRYAVYMGINSFGADQAVYLGELDILKDGCYKLNDDELEQGLNFYRENILGNPDPHAEYEIVSVENNDEIKQSPEIKYDKALLNTNAYLKTELSDFWTDFYKGLIEKNRKETKAFVIVDPESYNRWYLKKYYLFACQLARLGNYVLYINIHMKDNYKMPVDKITEALDMDRKGQGFDIYLSTKKISDPELDWIIGKWMALRDVPGDDVDLIYPGLTDRMLIKMHKLISRMNGTWMYADNRYLQQLPETLEEIEPVYSVSEIYERITEQI